MSKEANEKLVSAFKSKDFKQVSVAQMMLASGEKSQSGKHKSTKDFGR